MGFFDIFKPGGETIKGALEGAGTLAKDVREAITGDYSPEQRKEIEAKILQIESDIKQAQASVIIAEATGESWLQRSWRPLTMLTFVVIIILNQFSLFPEELSEEIWAVLKIGIGGYVIGQSAEVVADKWNKT
ncbi:MAG: 3TM-type holin [Chloroflexota bacterium]|nr:3TM-type holin [Chloroflexota bacterium]